MRALSSTHFASLIDVSADFILLRARVWAHEFQTSGQRQRQMAAGTQPRKRRIRQRLSGPWKGGRVGGCGWYRAGIGRFLRGMRIQSTAMRRQLIWEENAWANHVQQMGGEEYASLLAVGASGTRSFRAGWHSFSCPAKRRLDQTACPARLQKVPRIDAPEGDISFASTALRLMVCASEHSASLRGVVNKQQKHKEVLATWNEEAAQRFSERMPFSAKSEAPG